MKFVSYQHGGAARFGIATDAGVIELNGRTSAASLRALMLEGGLPRAAAFASAAPDHAWTDVEFLPVIPDASKIVCIGVNYLDHAEEMRPGAALPKFPTVFARFADSQVGHDQPIALTRHSEAMDYECELAVIIGKAGRDIAEADALDHVAGYACYNDISLRVYQRHTTQFTPGKNFTGCGSFGPWMVTPDEFGPIGSKRIKTRVDGEIRQNASLESMIFSVPKLIAYISEWSHLQPGDVIITGTPAGVAAGMAEPRWLKAGQTVEVEIDGIGVLSNKIV